MVFKRHILATKQNKNILSDFLREDNSIPLQKNEEEIGIGIRIRAHGSSSVWFTDKYRDTQ